MTLVNIEVDDYVFETIERAAIEYAKVTGSEESGRAIFVKLILTEHLLLHFRGALSPELFDRLTHLKYDGRGLMEFFLDWDDARRGTAGYSMVMDANGRIEAIDTPVGTADPVDTAWHTPEDFEHLAEAEAKLREGRKQD